MNQENRPADSVVSTIIWITVSRELGKTSDRTNVPKLVTLMSAGTLSTIVLTISLFQDIRL
ncbi:hypothetical protein [Guptibacillus spartinae]|uniref:hypothetical protein n=1 Tax=Guptibacillus spartinae TaxID=3025679 RepID=UPI0023622956|nr:hypothetical protein [Pseudalkalibacillus spartinae]